MRLALALSVVGLVITLPGCAVMNEQACLVTDWRSVGFEDGAAGRSAGSIGNYRQACSKHGVTPDLDQYRAGHAEGVELYCGAGNGFEVGRRGGRYQGVCPADVEPTFLAAYSEGRQLYELEAAVRDVDSQIAQRHRRSEALAREVASAGAAIISQETSPEQRAELLLGIAAMGKEQGEISKELESLQVERVMRESELAAYRQALAFNF